MTESKTALSKTQRSMVLVFVMVALAFGGLYVYMKHVGVARAQHHQISFYEYILQHHVGQLTDIDDGAGFDPNSYVLTVTHRVPDAQIQEYALRLMKLYVKYDRGMGLTIMVQRNATDTPKPMADVIYDDEDQQVTVTETDKNGNVVTVKRHVNW